MKLSEFDYKLPKELIAQVPVHPKDHSKLMVLLNNNIEHLHFYNLVDYLKSGDVLVINTTKVMRSKLYGRKSTGSRVSVILTKRLAADTFEARVQADAVHVGQVFIFGNKLSCKVIAKDYDIFTVQFTKPLDEARKQKSCELPGPPYVRERIEADQDYQTVYGTEDGSLAAPTAGLHFTNALLKRIREKGVVIAHINLSIGFGTFLPIERSIKDHKMHAEEYAISHVDAEKINSRKGRLIAVGTTVVRALESSADARGMVMPGKGTTSLFIYPGYRFKVKFDILITNFHLPKSTLLLLVSAYMGTEKLLAAYREAIKKKYRFYSFGDAMLIIN